jgi:rubredoxin
MSFHRGDWHHDRLNAEEYEKYNGAAANVNAGSTVCQHLDDWLTCKQCHPKAEEFGKLPCGCPGRLGWRCPMCDAP